MNPYRINNPPLDLDRIAGENVAARRRTLGMSRVKLAQRLDRDESWMRRIEEGQVIPAHQLPLLGYVLELNDPFILYKPAAFK
jgi:ribosome-binding protein aMBF1 (putative translation factor)